MKTFNYTIKDPIGLHARPAGMLMKAAKQFKSVTKISFNGREADVTRLMTVMAMGIKCGAEVTVTVEGEDEETAAVQLQSFFEENL